MSLNDKSVAGALLQTIKKYIDKHISVLTTSLNNKNKTKRFKVSKGATSVATGTPFITNESLISFDRIIGNPATSIANIGVDGDYFVESGTIHFKEFNKDIVISCGVNYGVHDISHADVLGQGTTENDISVMKHELDMLSGSGIGHNGIYYIQDVGSKEAGKIYLDKTQEGVWKCLNTTSSINNTSDFERIDNMTLDDKLRNLYSHYVNGQTYSFNIGILKVVILKAYCPNRDVKNYQLPISFQTEDSYGIFIEPNKNIDQQYNSEYGVQVTRLTGNMIQVASNYPTNYGFRLICIGV